MINPLNLINVSGDLVDHLATLGAAGLAVWGFARRQYKRFTEERESNVRLRKAFLVLVDQVRQTQDVVRQLANERWDRGDPRKRKIDELTDFLYRAEGHEGHRGEPDIAGLSMGELRAILKQAGKEAE